MTDESATDGAHDDDSAVSISRRELLGAGIGAALGVGASVAGQGVVTADPQGGIGSPSNPVEAAYLTELRGPISDQGRPITSLVSMRAVEDSASISPGQNTLVFRYDPTTTV